MDSDSDIDVNDASDLEEDYCDRYDNNDNDVLTLPDEEKKPLALLYEIPQSTQKQKDIEDLFNISITNVCTILKIPNTVAVRLLQTYKWDTDFLIKRYTLDPDSVLRLAAIIPLPGFPSKGDSDKNNSECQVCLSQEDEMFGLNCDHDFCVECWRMHIIEQISNGMASEIACMSQNCAVKVTGELARYALKGTQYLEVYNSLFFNDLVKSHPLLRRCVGPDCTELVIVEENGPKRIVCGECKSEFCFKCGGEYHSFMSCELKKDWLIQCQSDGNTMKYIKVNTKDCPKCFTCIEKNGGCNHVICRICQHGFCWQCLSDWKKHSACNRFDESASADMSAHRASLEKYVFYTSRFDNQTQSIILEKEQFARLRDRIEEAIMKRSESSTWIDWQLLDEAAETLHLSRLTLKYSYAFAFFLKPSARKDLFEYQQGMLEKEVENLSEMIEKGGLPERRTIALLIRSCNKYRTTLLSEFS